MPALARFGLMVLAGGMFADLAFHASGADGYPAHVVMLVGMLVVLSGVVRQGLEVRPTPGFRTRDAVGRTSSQTVASDRGRRQFHVEDFSATVRGARSGNPVIRHSEGVQAE